MQENRVYDAIDDLDFQLWCSARGFIEIEKIDFDALANVEPRQSKVQRELWKILADNCGFILSKRKILQEINATGLTEESLRHTINATRRSFGHVAEIRSWMGVGSAIGVSDLRLKAAQLPILHRLVRLGGKPVTHADLSEYVYGDSHPCNVRAVRTNLYFVRRLFPPDMVPRVLETSTASRLLMRKETLPLPPLMNDLPEWLAEDFQDWLAKDIGGIEPRSLQTTQPKLTMLTEYEQRVHRVFSQFEHKVIPMRYLARVVYGDPEYDHRLVRQIVNGYRGKLTEPEAVVNCEHLGYMHNAEVKLSRSALIMMYVLWKAKGTAVSRVYIESKLEELGVEIMPYTFSKMLGKVLDHLRCQTAYRVEIKRGIGDRPTMYKLQQFEITSRE